MNLSNKVMRGGVPALCLVVATLAAGAVGGAVGAGAGEACERGRSWWDRTSGVCAPCTRCDPPHLAVQYPCEPHRDAVCQPISDIRIFPFNTPRKTNTDARDAYSDYDYYEYADDEASDTSDSEVKWDLQTSTLTLAASGCVVFFVVVLSLSLYHTREWRILKQALRSDVQDLSAKLKLMEAGEAPAEPVLPADHHVYCNIHVAKDALLSPTSGKQGLGNVYTQEKHSS